MASSVASECKNDSDLPQYDTDEVDSTSACSLNHVVPRHLEHVQSRSQSFSVRQVLITIALMAATNNHILISGAANKTAIRNTHLCRFGRCVFVWARAARQNDT